MARQINSIKLMIALMFAGILFSVNISSAFGSGLTWAESIGTDGKDDVFRAIEQGCDGGHILAGYTDGAGAGKIDILVIKLNSTGGIEWQETVGGTNDDTLRGITAVCDGNDGYVLTGLSKSGSFGANDMFAALIDWNGAIIWKVMIGTGSADASHGVDRTLDGDYILAGYTTKSSQKDYFVARVDGDSGALEWQKRYDSPGGDDVIRTVKVLSSGHIMVAGWSKSVRPDGDILLMMLNENTGQPIWIKRYGGSGFEEASTILELPDSGIVVFEESKSFTSSQGGWIFKIDQNGNMLKQKLLDGTNFDEFSAGRITDDNNIIIAGEFKKNGDTPENFWIVKYDFDLNLIFQKQQGGIGQDEAEDIALTDDGGFLAAGISTLGTGMAGQNIWIAKMDSVGNLQNCDSNKITSWNATTAAKEKVTTGYALNVTTINALDAGVKQKQITVWQVKASNVEMDVQCKEPILPPVNVPPVAFDDGYDMAVNGTLTVSTENGVLANDTDADLDSLTALLQSTTTNGVLEFNEADGSFEYTPAENFAGTDSFTYKASDGTDESNVATVTITVNRLNDPPIAMDDSYVAAQDTELVEPAPGVLVNDSDPDGDSFTALQVSGPSNGSLVLSENGRFTYTPNPGYTGPDAFTYKANDGTADSIPATVTITVTAG